MKKRIAAMLLCGLLLTNVTTCHYVPGNDVNNETNDAANTQVKEYEVSLKGYDAVISEYRSIVELCRSPSEEITDERFSHLDAEAQDIWKKIYNDTLCLTPRDSDGIEGVCLERLGYTIKDLNKDGIDELILRVDDHETTFVKGKVCMFTKS